ncbi:efflux RND transporter periplasmic adaptor subunit [Bradyrhizobium cenepequi]|uniref:efflux RND transporter periplasmic adaptor subunit n=1 Tax=Bradyrhizobium cenepequi TaxID=2821403 RepID=UPI001CE2A92B|nr:efflux RND transporter periplasmic adaptor subunit [Bradyrhizobium cenepequi]MCA6109624.1 efflux RND transporter periplasmic adaptor subunit [Bradyrhizobium cenepequi]
MRRILLFVAGIIVGGGLGIAIWSNWPLSGAPAQQETATGGAAKAESEDHGTGHIALSDEQIKDAGITLAPVAGGMLKRHFLAPGSLVPDADHIGRVSVRVLATVAELRKRLGDSVEKGEIVAVIESREVADAKSQYLAARLTNDLQQTLYNRQKTLAESRAMSENEFLRTQLAANDARIKLDGARQKLFALGLSEKEIADLPNQPPESLREQHLRAPISGRVSERRVDVGGLIGREGQESELFVIVNLDDIWVDLAVSPEDIAAVHEGGLVTIRAIGSDDEAVARVIFVSPLLDRETRNARVIATLPNRDHRWRPGTFVTAEVPLGGEPSRVIVSKKALQTVRGNPTIFVRDAVGFEARQVRTGREDDDDVEIVSGLSPGETIAVANTFTLKAELEKAEAEHGHD